MGIVGASFVFLGKLLESLDCGRIGDPPGDLSIPACAAAQFIAFHRL